MGIAGEGHHQPSLVYLSISFDLDILSLLWQLDYPRGRIDDVHCQQSDSHSFSHLYIAQLSVARAMSLSDRITHNTQWLLHSVDVV